MFYERYYHKVGERCILNNIHITLVLLAYAFLVSICLQAPRPLPAPAEDSRGKPAPPLIALTPSEVRHLLAHLIWPAPTAPPLICQWSIFRRTHQYCAGYYHRRRREKACSRLPVQHAPPSFPKPPPRPGQDFSGEASGET